MIATPLQVKNPKWGHYGDINCEVEWNIYSPGQLLPYTASKNDCCEHGRDLFHALERGDYGPVAALTTEDIQEHVTRENEKKRDAMMRDADSVIRPLSDERDAEIISDEDLIKWKAWVKYRKALRETDMSHEDVSWPDKPE